MTDRYNYEGGGFWYRGSYYGYDSENGFFRSTGGGTLSGSDYHYDWGFGAYVNRFGQQVSFQDVNFNFVLPNQSDFTISWNKRSKSINGYNLNNPGSAFFNMFYAYDFFEICLKAKYKPYPIESRPSDFQNTITNADERDLRSFGVSGALAYPGWGKGI
jgi:hypothetical protein